MWAWPMGVPETAPNTGFMYDPNLVFSSAAVLAGGQPEPGPGPVTMSYAFDTPNLTFAGLQSHPPYNLSVDLVNLHYLTNGVLENAHWATGHFTLEAQGEQDGTDWNRGIQWGVGTCA